MEMHRKILENILKMDKVMNSRSEIGRQKMKDFRTVMLDFFFSLGCTKVCKRIKDALHMY